MVNYLVTLRGTLGTSEEFSHTLAVQSGVLPTPATVAAAASQAFALAHAQGVTGWASGLSNQVAYHDTSAAVILNLNTGELGAAAHVAYVDPGLVGSGAAGAFQVAGAVSLTAGVRPNGQPLRGRFYLPLVGEAGIADGFFISTIVQGVADTIGFFLGELLEADITPCVWSRTLGVLQPVTAARFGNVPDTIRSRRNQLTEVYEPIAITPVP